MQKPNLTLHLAAPRGFCAGVDRAIQIVEKALERFGAPVYVRHEIVHNRHVVEELERKGAIFVEELDEIPGQFPVVFSAHGVPKVVPAEAERRNLLYLDATCPLVSKVHREAEGHYNVGRHILLIGHAGHPEVIGTIGQLPPGAVTLVETVEDVAKVELPQTDNLAYITQTTLSVDDTVDIIDTVDTVIIVNITVAARAVGEYSSLRVGRGASSAHHVEVVPVHRSAIRESRDRH